MLLNKLTLNLSFSYHPLIDFQKKLSIILPGIDYSLLIYLDNNKTYNYIHKLANEEIESIENSSKYEIALSKLLNTKWNYKWFTEENLFENNKILSSHQLSIEDETTYLLLAIKLTGFLSEGNDFIIIKFNQYSLNYEITKSKKELSNEIKIFAGNFLYNFLKTMLNTESDNKLIFNNIKQQIEIIQNNIVEPNSIEKSLRQSLKKYISTFIINRYLSKAKIIDINISDDAIDKIALSGLELHEIETEIDRIVSYKVNVFNEFKILLNANDFILNSKAIKEEEQIEEVKSNYLSTYEEKKLKKAFDLLESLQAGAIKIKEGYIEKNKSKSEKERNLQAMTYENMAKVTFSTAPGVLYKIKDAKKEILELLKKYPNKWMLLRTEFAPIYKLSMPNFLDKKSKKESI